MSGVDFLYRTVPFKHFQKKVGYAVANLNTVIVGLAAVKTGIAQKPTDLAVSWPGKNPTFLAAEARQFATKSLLVYAVDALDKYLEHIGLDPSPIVDKSLRDILVGEPQIISSPAKSLPAAEIAELSEALDGRNPDEIITKVREFNNKFGGKRKPLHIRARLDALSDAMPVNPSHYLAAVRLLVSWRNRHVHQSDEQIATTDRDDLLNNKSIFWNDHSHTDIALTLQHYGEGEGPSLKDISTLVSVLQRAMRALDEAIIAKCDLNEFIRRALRQTFKQTGDGQQRLKLLWGLPNDVRKRKLAVYLRNFGFQPEVIDKKNGRVFPEVFFEELFRLDRTAAANYLCI